MWRCQNVLGSQLQGALQGRLQKFHLCETSALFAKKMAADRAARELRQLATAVKSPQQLRDDRRKNPLPAPLAQWLFADGSDTGESQRQSLSGR